VALGLGDLALRAACSGRGLGLRDLRLVSKEAVLFETVVLTGYWGGAGCSDLLRPWIHVF
jgi:hypothetical protein